MNLHKKATFCSAASELSQEEGYEFILRKEEISKTKKEEKKKNIKNNCVREFENFVKTGLSSEVFLIIFIYIKWGIYLNHDPNEITP